MRTEDLSQREQHHCLKETARGESYTMSEKKNDQTDSKSIRIERFIDDGEGLIITYPDKDNTQTQDKEASS